MKSSRIKIFAFFAFSAVLIGSCKKSTDHVSLEYSAWVESSDRLDTLVFKGGSLILNRPKELRNGNLLPKIGAGPYSFRELRDSIGLMHSLSSLYRFNNYAFKIEKNRLYIGDFYQKRSGQNQLLTFDKLR